MTHFSETRTYQPISLPFKITKFDDEALIKLDRNFSEIERLLSLMQVYENKTGVKVNDTFYFDPDTGDVSFAGNLKAAGGTFSGELQAASGTFSGKLEAATGTFAGSLSAARGTIASLATALDGARVTIGTTPYLRMYDSAELRVEILNDRIKFYREGELGGEIFAGPWPYAPGASRLILQAPEVIGMQVSSGNPYMGIFSYGLISLVVDSNRLDVTTNEIGCGPATFTMAGNHGVMFMAGGALKILSGGVMQARNGWDTGYEEVHAADFIPASSREFKEDIQVAESENALQQVLNTPIYRYRLKEKKAQKIGFIAEEAPEILRAGEGISLGNSIGLLWKAVQELTKKVEKLESKEV
ncbi:MAG: tail fiber domain-containing protein [Sphaerochaeta sp.]|jgi:hypothetical protein|nr:tail fiber domain-containing protein [Sphaerochaeta sp.]